MKPHISKKKPLYCRDCEFFGIIKQDHPPDKPWCHHDRLPSDSDNLACFYRLYTPILQLQRSLNERKGELL